MSDETNTVTVPPPCKGCWWEEGRRCYLEPVTRLPDGRSTKMAEGRCSDFLCKRKHLERVIPGDKLAIVSEHTRKGCVP